MTKLNQLIAVVGGLKARTEATAKEVYHALQQGARFSGLKKTYLPKDDEGEVYPGETVPVELQAEDLLERAAKAWVEAFDAVLSQDDANCQARADVKVDGQLIVSDVPVTYLLFLEKQLTNVRNVMAALPVLDPVKSWDYSEEAACFLAAPLVRTKTKKVKRYQVVSEATEQHPAQVAADVEDIVEGNWSTIESSGAMTQDRKNALMRNATLLIDAVKVAREEANGMSITQRQVAKELFEFLGVELS